VRLMTTRFNWFMIAVGVLLFGVGIPGPYVSADATVKHSASRCKVPKKVSLPKDQQVWSKPPRKAAGFVRPNGLNSKAVSEVFGVAFVESVSLGLGQTGNQRVSLEGPYYPEPFRRLCGSAISVLTESGTVLVPGFVFGGSVYLTNDKGALLEVRSQAPDTPAADACLGGSFRETDTGAVYFLGAPWAGCKMRDGELILEQENAEPIPVAAFLRPCSVQVSDKPLLNLALIPSKIICPTNASIPYVLPTSPPKM
jgi:hypothetical protein